MMMQILLYIGDETYLCFYHYIIVIHITFHIFIAGSGVVGLQVAKTYPHMEVKLLEMPQTAEVLRKLFVPKSGCTNVKVLDGKHTAKF